jgi:unsaturated rhamnogalacturonyl hydrolase
LPYIIIGLNLKKILVPVILVKSKTVMCVKLMKKLYVKDVSMSMVALVVLLSVSSTVLCKSNSIPSSRVSANLRADKAAVKSSEENINSKKYIVNVMKKVSEWQAANPVERNNKNINLWARAVFYTGIMSAYNTTKDKRYLEIATKWAEERQWKLGDRLRHADDHTPAQTYLELYLKSKNKKKNAPMLAHTREIVEQLMANPKPGREDWWWCDALFMSPPLFTRLYAVTGDKRYLDFMHKMWWDTTDFLFDKEESLYYRDKSFFNKQTPSGKKVFWSRGNGWVMGGIVRVLQYLPKNDPYRKQYIDLLQKMAVAVSRQQQEDGLWRPSLLDPNEVPHAEASGSSFFCYALAWGINNGHLDRKTYLPVVKRAWKGLVGLVNQEGKLGWVQPIGASPDKVTADNFQEYGSGAFLLAATELYKLKG